MTTELGAVVERIAKKSQHTSVISGLATGVFAGLLVVILSVTYAALIFSGDLSVFLSHGVSLAIASVVMVGTTLLIFSKSAFFIPQIDDDTAPVFALLLSFLVLSLPASIDSASLFANILAAIFIASLIASLVLTLFGTFNYGSFVQFLPYSVMGGYFAAVGWLLLVGSISMLTKLDLMSLSNLTLLFKLEVLVRWLPAVVVGLCLRAMVSRFDKGPLLAFTIIGFSALFYSVAWVFSKTPEWLLNNDYLMGPFGELERGLLAPVSNINWEVVSMDSVVGNLASMTSIALISLLSIVLCISAISLTTRQDLDPNRELRVTGLANLATALFGGMLALPSVSVSQLSYDLHPKPRRLVGITAISVAVLSFYFGMSLIAHIPKMLLGALLIYIGSGLVVEWLFNAYRKFGAFEYSVIPIILVVSVFVGFLASIIVGVVAAIILFVIKYSRIRVVRYQAAGDSLRSNLIRDSEQSKVISEFGNQTQIFKLQGFLFFGTAGTLYSHVLSVVRAPEHSKVQYVILDFSQVIGVDSSAALNFEKLAQRLAERKIYLITTSLKSELLAILNRGGLDLANNLFLIQRGELDSALEWCENNILEEHASKESQHQGLFERMAEALPQSKKLHRLQHFLEKREVKKGDVLTRIGETSDEVFFLESCTASAYIVDSANQERRVSGAGRGAIYGEIGFFLGIPRTAIVRADSDGDIYSLSSDALKEMKRDEPELASALTHHLAQVVTERLVNTTQSLRSVM